MTYRAPTAVFLVILVVLSSVGCSDSPTTDAGLGDSGSLDSGAIDSGDRDTGTPDSAAADSGPAADTSMPDSMVSDTGVDADAGPPMDSATAVDAAADATVDACADGGCAAPVCGDGVRTPGPSPDREGCDDGNLTGGDACSPTCVPVPFAVHGSTASSSLDHPALQGMAAAAEGGGNLLIVWVNEPLSGAGRILARRYSSTGVSLAPAFELDRAQAAIAEPQVIGLASGWVVVWSDNDFELTQSDISYRIIEADGTVGPLRTANQDTAGPQTQPRATALTDGFVISWTNLIPTAEERGRGLMARVFHTTGTPRGNQFAVATNRVNDQHFSYLAAVGTGWIAVWTHSATAPGAFPVLYGRRFNGATPVDSTQFEVSAMTEGGIGSVTALESGAYAAAWVMDSDIHARVIPAAGIPTPSPGAHLILANTADNERAPSVAGLAGSDFLVVHGVLVSGSSASLGHHIATSPGTPTVPESPALAALLGHTRVERASVTRTPNGLWFVWNGGASDAIWAHFLPFD